jgi:hypothetical protein
MIGVVTRVANRTILYSIVLYFDSLYYILLKKYIVRTNTIFWGGLTKCSKLPRFQLNFVK